MVYLHKAHRECFIFMELYFRAGKGPQRSSSQPLPFHRWGSEASKVMRGGGRRGPLTCTDGRHPPPNMKHILVFPTLVVWGNLVVLMQYGICTGSGCCSEAGWRLAGCTSGKKGRGQDYKDKQNNPILLKIDESQERSISRTRHAFLFLYS